MGRSSNTAERRDQITQALLRVMARKGYEGASVAEVAGEAGLAAGLVHYHFGSKLEILVSLFDSIVARLQQRLEQRLAEAGPAAWSQIEASLDCYLAMGPDRDPEALACWVAINGEALRLPEVQSRLEGTLRQMAQRLGSLIQGGIEAGDFEGVDPQAAASALLATIQGYSMLSATARVVIPRGSAAGSAKRMAAGLLGFRGPRVHGVGPWTDIAGVSSTEIQGLETAGHHSDPATAEAGMERAPAPLEVLDPILAPPAKEDQDAVSKPAARKKAKHPPQEAQTFPKSTAKKKRGGP